MTKLIAMALLGSIGFLTSARRSGMEASSPQSVDPSVGRHLAETVCSACHQINATLPNPSPNPAAPSFVDIARMPSTNELAIKVFLRYPTPHHAQLHSEFPEEIELGHCLYSKSRSEIGQVDARDNSYGRANNHPIIYKARPYDGCA